MHAHVNVATSTPAVRLRPILVSALTAGTLSGLPSTAWAVASGRNVFEAARAAGTLAPGRRQRPDLLAGLAVHGVVSLFWTALIDLAARRRPMGPREGAAAGVAIAALDLAVIGRRYPAIRALPAIPQWCDHVAFGVTAAVVLARGDATDDASVNAPSACQRRRR